jgi:hypothetical protein
VLGDGWPTDWLTLQARGLTPLHVACQFDAQNAEVIGLLVNAGADVFATTGKTYFQVR